jgi:TatD DNase family protein
MVTVASDLRDAREALRLADDTTGLWCTAGLHPHDARAFDAVRDPDALRSLATEPSVVAIGETGLDYFYDNSPRTEQGEAFEAQLEVAAETGLPVVVHSRASDAETVSFIRRFAGRVRGVLHCFSGGAALLEAGLDEGWFVSFSGMVTFKKFADEELVRRVPDERLLIETDSPYLAPVPKRGKRNEPAFLRHTCEAVASIRGARPEATAERTAENACRFYQVELPS